MQTLVVLRAKEAAEKPEVDVQKAQSLKTHRLLQLTHKLAPPQCVINASEGEPEQTGSARLFVLKKQPVGPAQTAD